MSSSAQDKNLPATPRRLEKAREEGQIPRSRDLTHIAVLGGGAVLLTVLAPSGVAHLRQTLKSGLSFNHSSVVQAESVLQHLSEGTTQAVMSYLPLGVLVAFFVVAVTVASGGYAYSTKPLMPELSKIGILSGFKRLFSKQQFFEILKLTAITVSLSIVAGLFLKAHMPDFGTLMLSPLDAGMDHMADAFKVGIGAMLAVVALIAAIDVPLQHFLHRQRLKMSLQEVKDEHKESDGNPQLKGKLRQRQREIAQGNSVSKVPQADLVVMNPTHYAVALKYDEATMAAPHVIAKGADLIAMRIRDMAKDNDVPVLQAPMLARALYAHTEIDQQVPSELFTAVAQVLAYVFRLRAALRGEGPMPGEPPKPEVPVELDPHHGRETAPI